MSDKIVIPSKADLETEQKTLALLKSIAAKMCKKDPFQRPTADKIISMLVVKDGKSADEKSNALLTDKQKSNK